MLFGLHTAVLHLELQKSLCLLKLGCYCLLLPICRELAEGWEAGEGAGGEFQPAQVLGAGRGLGVLAGHWGRTNTKNKELAKSVRNREGGRGGEALQQALPMQPSQRPLQQPPPQPQRGILLHLLEGLEQGHPAGAAQEGDERRWCPCSRVAACFAF